MKFEVQRAADFILDTTQPEALRAIEFFTLIVALHSGQSVASVTGHKASSDQNSLILKVSRKILTNAKLLAALKFLDQIEDDLIEHDSKRAISLRTFADHDEFREIFDEVILKSGSWNRIRFTAGLRDFENDVDDWRKQGRNIARVLDFSVRFVPDPEKRRQTGGITMATDIVTSSEGRAFFGTSIGSTEMEKAWARLKSASPFLYLLYRQKYSYFLKGIANKGFAKKWRMRIINRGDLLRFFDAYNATAHHLKSRGYHFTLLRLPSEPRSSDFDIVAFKRNEKNAKALLRAIEDYRK